MKLRQVNIKFIEGDTVKYFIDSKDRIQGNKVWSSKRGSVTKTIHIIDDIIDGKETTKIKKFPNVNGIAFLKVNKYFGQRRMPKKIWNTFCKADGSMNCFGYFWFNHKDMLKTNRRLVKIL